MSYTSAAEIKPATLGGIFSASIVATKLPIVSNNIYAFSTFISAGQKTRIWCVYLGSQILHTIYVFDVICVWYSDDKSNDSSA